MFYTQYTHVKYKLSTTYTQYVDFFYVKEQEKESCG